MAGTFVRYNDGIALRLDRVSIPTIDKQMIDRAQWEENNPNGKEYGVFARGLDTVKSSYDVIMIIKPGDEVILTRDDIFDYLKGH
ncbi:MAG: hypothetical protein Q8S22_08495 [Eubacteriales bacterium]|nr:hypothetical protein [Eubacteriales bacterium]